jgi:chromosome segregation ATPase
MLRAFTGRVEARYQAMKIPPCLVPALALSALALLTACSTTDDPSKGGLVSYWAHGEDAYRQRLDERQALLEQSRARSAGVEAEQAELQAQLDAAREELRQQETRLERLHTDLTGLEKETATMTKLTGEAQAEHDRLQEELGRLKKEMQAVATEEPGDDQAMEEQIRSRQKRIAELEKDLKALRERASLLTTL